MSTDARRFVVGGAAVVYGLGVAFGGSLGGEESGFWKAWLMVGAFVILALWLVLMVIPWVAARAAR
ncbi:MAG: hypothetical protein V9G19_17305 [Tetrasphaera sp.]